MRLLAQLYGEKCPDSCSIVDHLPLCHHTWIGFCGIPEDDEKDTRVTAGTLPPFLHERELYPNVYERLKKAPMICPFCQEDEMSTRTPALLHLRTCNVSPYSYVATYRDNQYVFDGVQLWAFKTYGMRGYHAVTNRCIDKQGEYARNYRRHVKKQYVHSLNILVNVFAMSFIIIFRPTFPTTGIRLSRKAKGATESGSRRRTRVPYLRRSVIKSERVETEDVVPCTDTQL